MLNNVHNCFYSFVKKSLERICANLQQRGAISSFDEPTLKGAFSKEKMQREIEWQRLHPGMDALLSHRSKHPITQKENNDIADEDNEPKLIDSDYDDDKFEEEELSVPKKRGSSSTTVALPKQATRGRGRGRGRGFSAPVAASLSMTSEAKSIKGSTTDGPSTSRWPPRRF